jgi:PAS domain S-box-containing protein
MKEFIKEQINKNGLALSIYFILFLVIGNTVFSIVFRNDIVKNSRNKELVISALSGIESMNTNVNLADMGLRGYMIIPDDAILNPMVGAVENYQSNLDALKSDLNDLGYDISKMDDAEKAIQNYMRLVQDMAAMVRHGDVQSAVDILRRDPGYDAWAVYVIFDRDARSFVGQVSAETEANYTKATVRMMLIQIGFLIISAPVLLLAVFSFKKGRKLRQNLFQELLASNNEYIFNSGEEQQVAQNHESGIINLIITNLRQATDFISRITTGEYNIEWNGLNKSNAHLNSNNIAGKLSTMRDQMKKVKLEDEKRIWISQGLSDFAAIIRKNQNDFNSLSVELISNIVRHLDIQMGGLFILNDDDRDNIFLELKGCYAYNRVKTLEKHIDIGKGLVGQCYLEGETIYMTNVPQDFVNITSGLGDSRPESVLIVPLKLNDRIEGVIELASLRKFEDYEIEFIEKLGETLASAITTVRSGENTKVLLEQSQQQTEEMRAQEEEMRQNMEELQATQEQIHRKNEEVEALLLKASEREQLMIKQNEIIAGEKEELETEKSILTTLMELLPERITIKDVKGKYLKISEAKYSTLRAQGYKDLIGKSDKDIFGNEHFEKSFSVEKELMNSKKPVLNIEEKIKITNDHSIWGLTSRVPFINTNGKVLGTIVITRDITKEKTCEEELEKLKSSS